MALAMLLQDPLDGGRYEEILAGYASEDEDANIWIRLPLVVTLITLLSTLIEAWADETGSDADEVVNYLLLEKFKRDMDEVDG